MTLEETLATAVADAIKRLTANLTARVGALETRAAAPGPVGPAGPQGLPGAPGQAAPLGPMGPAGPAGPAGQAGGDGLPGREGATGRDGRDGLPGTNGQDGAPGAAGPAGQDGTLETLTATYDGTTRTLSLAGALGRAIPGAAVRFNVPEYRGVFSAATTYAAADQVTCAGALWIAKTATSQRPDEDGDGARDWLLCAKRGPEGKRGPAGPAGLPGRDGAAGRDLTQLGADGAKW